MANLNSWQKIDRVLKGKPWGDGRDGPATISSDVNTRATYSATADSASGTAGSSDFANGDLVKCIQTQGTGVGQWEYNQVVSGGGTTSLVMKEPNHYSYGTGAQIIKIPRYTVATINSYSVTPWNGTIGGDGEICAKISATVAVSNTLSAVCGFRGAGAVSGPAQSGSQGEGNTGTGGVSSAANTQGGGGGVSSGESGGGGGGGGGGYAAIGTAGSSGGGSNAGGTGGAAAGVADLTSQFLGGGSGGGGTDDAGGTGGAGAVGGGILTINTKNLINSGNISVNGNAGGNGSGYCGGGGGGAAGSLLVICETATLGSNTMTATGGAGGAGPSAGAGGAGSVGRIAVHHSGVVTGTTNPAFTDVTDITLKESFGGGFLMNFI